MQAPAASTFSGICHNAAIRAVQVEEDDVGAAIIETAQSEGASASPRALGFLDVLALGVNCVIGSGVFLLPGLVADGPGPLSLVAVAIAGTVACLIALCFAEVSSRFQISGGAYAYAKLAFGDAVGFGVGWVAALAGVIAWAAIVNAFAVTLGALIPAAGAGAGRVVAIVGLLVVLGTLNVLGIRLGAGVSTAVTGIKIAALVGFVSVGLFFVDTGHFVPLAPLGWGTEGWRALADGALLMLYAFVGFENLVVPAGEIKSPERTLPFAIVAIMALVTVLYLGVQAVAIGTLETLPGTANAVAVAAGAFLGPAGERAIGTAVVISVLGVAAASALILPRRVSALANLGHLPAALGTPHRRFGTPWLSVVLVHVLAGAVALSGSFRELVVLAVLARFLQYAPTCLAVIVLRRRSGGTPTGFRLPGGSLIPVLALAASALLLIAARGPHLLAFGVAVLAGAPVFWLMRRRRMAEPSRP